MADMTTVQIAEGINLHVHTTKKFKTNTVCILIRRPLRREEATLNALIDMILGMSCAKYDSAEKLAAKTERMYGAAYSCSVVKKGEEQMVQFLLEYLPENDAGLGITSAEAFGFLCEVIFNPLAADGGFAPDITDGEKRTLYAQIAARANHKSEYARHRFLEEMCSSEAFAIAGDGYAEDIDSITPQTAYEHYCSILEESPIEVLIIGNETAKNCTDDIRGMFTMRQRGNITKPDLPKLICPRAVRKNVHEHAQSSQGNLAMGYRGDISPLGKQAYGLMLANELFGGFAGSRLFSVVRERESLAYSVHSTMYRLKGIVAVFAGVDAANFAKAAKLINAQLEDIAQDNITPIELEQARKSLLKKHEAAKDYPAQMLDFYMMRHMLGDADDLDDVIKKLRDINTDEIILAAARLGIDTVYTLGDV